MQTIIGSDHAGFGMKEAIRAEFERWGLPLHDAGCFGTASADYPDIAREVAGRLHAGEFDRGILICGSGVGMSITANRFPGIRAALCCSEEMAVLSRRHNDANILVLPGRLLPIAEAIRMVRAWLDTPFEGGRHARRLAKIDDPPAVPREGES